METRAKWTDLIPDTGLRIAEVYDQGDKMYAPGISSVLQVTTGEGAQRNFTGKTSFGEIKKFRDGDNIPQISRDKTYNTSVAYNNYGGSVQVTANQIEDRDFDSQLDEMKDMSRSANYSQDKAGMQLFNGGFATTVTVNGYDMTWYGDGKPQFSTIHPTVVAGQSTQSNASSTGIKLGIDNYETASLALELQREDNGIALAFAGKKTLVVPMALERTAKETLQSELTPETANNAINVYKGAADLVVSKFLDSANGGSNTGFFLMYAGDAKLYHEVRRQKEMNSDVDILSKTVTYTVDARWANYSKEWKGTWASKGDLATYSS